MKANVGPIDKTLRIVAGLAILSLVFVLPGYYRWLGLIGLGPLLTGIFNFCPGYWAIGFSTAKKQK